MARLIVKVVPLSWAVVIELYVHTVRVTAPYSV